MPVVAAPAIGRSLAVIAQEVRQHLYAKHHRGVSPADGVDMVDVGVACRRELYCPVVLVHLQSAAVYPADLDALRVENPHPVTVIYEATGRVSGSIWISEDPDADRRLSVQLVVHSNTDGASRDVRVDDRDVIGGDLDAAGPDTVRTGAPVVLAIDVAR